MSPSQVVPVLLLTVAACLPDNPSDTDTTTVATSSDTDTSADTDTPTGGPSAGLFACASPPCTLVLVSQTLDDRVDIYDADTRTLRGRIDLDLKPAPSGMQSGNLLDEPYELALTSTDLLITLGHFPDSDKGSILRFPRSVFDDLAPGETFAADRYFNTATLTFNGDVQPLTHLRQEGIFLLPHPSGRMLIGVFANNLRSAPDTWDRPSELLVFDPTDLDTADLGSFDLGALDVPCEGGWRLEPLDPAATKIAVACDGSKTVAVLSLPDDFATATPNDAAAGITGCGYSLPPGSITQFVSADGAGNFLAVQSQIGQSPRLTNIKFDCSLAGMGKPPPDDLSDISILRQPVLARSAADGGPIWLVASAVPGAVAVIKKDGSSPTLCGRLGGLETLGSSNVPWALALNKAGTRLAIGAGPYNNPELGKGDGQILWGTLDPASLDSCTPTLTDVVDLNAGLFSASDPSTWVRAPNVITIAELEGDA